MRTKIQELEAEKKLTSIAPPPEASELAQGEETLSQAVSLKHQDGNKKEITLKTSWDKIFSYVGTAMIGECTEKEFLDKVKLVFWHSVPPDLSKHNNYNTIVVYHVVFDKIIIQLQALGLITFGTKKRAVSDTQTYWKLTSYGENYLLKISAIRSKKSQK